VLAVLFAIREQARHLGARDTERARNVIDRKGLLRLIEQRDDGEHRPALLCNFGERRHRTGLRVM
jgi:hypothetical protein